MNQVQQEQLRQLVEQAWKLYGELSSHFWEESIIRKVDNDLWENPLLPDCEVWEVLTRKDDRTVAVTHLGWHTRRQQWLEEEIGTHVINLDSVRLEKIEDYRDIPDWAFTYLHERKRKSESKEKDITLAAYEHLMQEAGFDRQSEQYRSEARRIIERIIEGMTVFDALETVENNILREKLRPFIYVTVLRAGVVILRESDAISAALAEDLRTYLRSLTEGEHR